MLTATRNAAPQVCGFCAFGTNSHQYCPGAIRSQGKLIRCYCGCSQSSIVRCLDCKSNINVDHDRWVCIDTGACKERQHARLISNPLIQQIQTIKENRKMSQNVDSVASLLPTTPRKPKEAKVGKCLVTGQPTKGGKFAPGQDAKYVSLAVNGVMEGKATEEETLARFAQDGVSDALTAKFTKGLRLARDRKAAAEIKARAAAEAKAAKAAEQVRQHQADVDAAREGDSGEHHEGDLALTGQGTATA